VERLTIAIVMFGIAIAFFKTQNAIMKGGIRPTAEVEEQGLDIPEMGVLAYDNLTVNEIDIVSGEGVETVMSGGPSPDPTIGRSSRLSTSPHQRTAAGGRPRLPAAVRCRVPHGASGRIAFGQPSVAEARFGEDQAGACRVVVQLPAQVADVHSQRSDFGPGAEAARQELVGDELAGIGRQHLEDLQLGAGEAHERAGVSDLTAGEVDLQVTEADDPESIPGSERSSTTASGRCAVFARRPSSPVSASTTSKPLARSVVPNARRRGTSSSTMSRRVIG
jgi:hypothetical protein